jgi:hypothetical protein
MFEVPRSNLTPVWNDLCIYHCKVRLLMKVFWTLTGAFLRSFTGRNSIWTASFPAHFLTTWAPANSSADQWAALADDFLLISFGRDSRANAASSLSNMLGSLLNSRWLAASTQLQGSIA